MTTYRTLKVDKGCYLQISDDGKNVYRIEKYTEDGSLEEDNGKKVKGEFWGLERLTNNPQGLIERDSNGKVISLLPLIGTRDEDEIREASVFAMQSLGYPEWQWYESLIPTKREAVQRAAKGG